MPLAWHWMRSSTTGEQTREGQGTLRQSSPGDARGLSLLCCAVFGVGGEARSAGSHAPPRNPGGRDAVSPPSALGERSQLFPGHWGRGLSSRRGGVVLVFFSLSSEEGSFSGSPQDARVSGEEATPHPSKAVRTASLTSISARTGLLPRGWWALAGPTPLPDEVTLS